MSTSKRPPDSATPGSALLRADLPRRVRRVLEQLFSMVCDQYATDLEQLLSELELELLRRSREPTPVRFTGRVEALDRLRQNRADLVPQFLVGVENSLAAIRQPGAGQVAAPTMLPNRPSSLRLVDEDEIDEDASLRMISVRHEARGSLPLLLLGQRFGVLAGAPAFEAERLPVGPHGLCRVLASSARSLQIDLDSRMLLYRLFDRHLASEYIPFLEAMNLLLVHENVLPGLSYVPLRTRRSSAPRSLEDQSPAPAGPQGSGGGKRSDRETAITPAPVAVYTGWPGVAGREPAADDDDSGMFEMLQQLLTERRGIVEKLRSRTGGQAPNSLANREVIEALARMQAQSPAGDSPGSVSDIRQAVLAQSRQSRGEASGLSREDSDAFELLGMLYGAIGRELRDDAPTRALLDRLQLPLLRLALQDRGFFLRSQHPARQLLNAVVEPGARWSSPDEADPQLDQQINHAVNHIIRHYQDDPAVFEAANQSLQQHLHKVARRSEVSERRHIEAARGKEKLELARRRTREVVEAAMQDQQVPRFLHTLLLQAWADVLTLVLLRHGEESAQWREHESATRQIIEAALQKRPPHADLVQLIQDGLGLVGYQGEEAASIARRLTSADDADDATEDPVSRTELAMKLKARTRLGPAIEQQEHPLPPRTPQEQVCYQQLRLLPFGTWMEFTINQQGDFVRRRLAWFSVVTDRALFVNQRGQRVDDQSLDQLARLVASGQARIVTTDNARIVDRAWYSTLGSLRQLANRQASDSENRR
ncbi:MAG: DUF1631 domain-containing protein [Pseudomonadota bacterium]|nr:DUF1631 domain-containing protein [Pseudomonadota bacterium]